MVRVFIGILLPIIIVLITWSVGEPPPKALFWQSESAEITAFEQEDMETGYGLTTFYFPIVTLSDGQTRRLMVDDDHDEALTKADWPVGTRLKVHLNPKNDTAYSKTDKRMHLFTAFVLAGGAMVIIGLAVRSLMVKEGVFSLALGGIGTVFVVIPLILFNALWTISEPPATSLFWPDEPVTVVSSEVKSRPVGNGTIAYYAVVVIRDADGQTVDLEMAPSLTGKRAAEASAAEFVTTATVRAKRSPEGVLHEQKWIFGFTLAAFISVMAPVMILIGLFMLWMSTMNGRSRRT